MGDVVGGVARARQPLGDRPAVVAAGVEELLTALRRELDDVAYVRFASVYRNFREAKDFETALAELSGEEDDKASPRQKE